MRSATKYVLYTTTGAGATMNRAPVAIFPNEKNARAFAVTVMTAYKAGDVERVKSLGCGHLVADDGKLKSGLRFNRIELPYDPPTADTSVDPFAEPSSATS